MNVRVSRLDWAGALAIADDWDALVAAQPFADPTRRIGWLRAWWRCFSDVRGRTGVFVAVHRGDRLVAAAPLMLERLPGGVRLLRHMGTSPHWFDPQPPVAPGDAEALAALAEGIAGIPADLVVLEDLVAGGEMSAALLGAMPDAVVRPQGECRYRYDAADPPSLKRRRRKCGQRRRALERAGRTVEFDVTRDRAVILGAVDEVADLVDRAWRERGDGSGITHPAGRRYLREALAALDADGAVLVRVRVDGRLAAFDLALAQGSSAVMFRGSWDPGSGASGVGWMSMLAAMDELLGGGAREIDFGKFDWDYKRELTGEARPALVTVAAARGVRGSLAMAAWRARPQVLQARRRLMGLLARAGIRR